MVSPKFLCATALGTTFLLLLLGGVVHNTESSLACPDWPLCYGQLIPPMERGIWIEHSHRLLASLVGLMTIGLVVTTRGKSQVYPYAKLALAFVIIQGILGGITVLYRLPTLVSTAHLALSMVFWCTLIFIFHQTKEKRLLLEEGEREGWNPSLRVELLFGGILLFIQIILGAFIRHSGAGNACGFGGESIPLCKDIVNWDLSWWPLSLPAKLHALHRYLGVGVMAWFIIWSWRMFFLKGKVGMKYCWPVFSILALIGCQIILGGMMVVTGLNIVPTTAHLGVAALILGLSWYLYWKLAQREMALFGKMLPTCVTDLVELMRPKLNALVLGTVLVGMILAEADIDGEVFFKGLMALVLIGLAAMGATTLNSYQERETDKLMLRTQNRPLPAGRFSPKVALFQGLLFLGISIPLIVIWVNMLTGMLTLLAALIYLGAYTPLKKKGLMALYVGAIAGALPPLLGYTALTNGVSSLACFLFALLVFWQLPHFLAISLYHAEDYKAAGIKTYPNLSGVAMTQKLIFIFTVLLVVCSLWPYFWLGAERAYLYAALILGSLFLFSSVKALFAMGEERVRGTAKEIFWASIFYLPLLLCGIVFLA